MSIRNCSKTEFTGIDRTPLFVSLRDTTRMSLYISCYEDMHYVIDRGVRSPRVDRVAIKQGRFAVDFRINALVCSPSSLHAGFCHTSARFVIYRCSDNGN